VSDREVEMLLEQAARSRARHDWGGAIATCKRALSLDPDHARAHAEMALCLLGARRLQGASVEVGRALALDGNDPACHHAAAAVRWAERRLADAWEHCLVAMQADPTDVDAHLLGASIRRAQGEVAPARELLERALELRSDNPDALAQLAALELDQGRIAEASRLADAALGVAPEHGDAHVTAGSIALRNGELAQAEQHARFVLTRDATDEAGLRLWTMIKMRRSWLWGLWWRFNAFVSGRGERGQIAILIGSFVVARLAMILAGALELERVEELLRLGWLGFCTYTWVAPSVFRRMLARELETVVLRPDF
jgi:tetratricopeptide (TPR) repeat protein